MAQVESAVEANEMKAPSRWQAAEAVAVVHLWPPTVNYCAQRSGVERCSAERRGALQSYGSSPSC